MIFQGQVGPQVLSDGSLASTRQLKDGSLAVSEVLARYYEQTYRGNSFFLSVASAAGTAFTGGAGGTPLLAIYNPAGSGKNLVLKSAMAAVVAAATAAGQTQFRLYGGVSVLPTGTLTNPTNALSLQTTGSIAKGISNAAMTSSTALSYITTIGVYWFAPQLTSGGPSAFLSPPVLWEAAGQIIVVPGNLLALGAVTIPTSMTNDAALFWDEVPA